MHNHDEDFEYDYTKEHILLNKLIELAGMGNCEYNILNFYSLNLKITLFLSAQNEGVANASFVISHPESDDDIVESVAAVGKNNTEALEKVAESFYITVLKSLLKVLDSSKKKTLQTILNGKKHLFHKCESEILYVGYRKIEEGYQNLYDLLKDDIAKYLGTKKLYLIKIYAAFSVDEYICEVRINGIIVPSLTEKITGYAKTWKEQGNYYTEKQCIIFLQDDTTFEVCPFTKKQVTDYTKILIKLFEKVENDDMYYDVYDEALKMTDNRSLAADLFYLIPEIYCKIGFSELKFMETIILVKNNGTTEKLCCYQMRNYTYIEEGIYNYLEDESPDNDRMFKVITLSARYNGLAKAVSEGSRLEDMKLGMIGIPVEDDYILY